MRIVIARAGLGRMAAVKSLKHTDEDFTLIYRINHHLFQPFLYLVATAALSSADIASATRALPPGHDGHSRLLKNSRLF